MSDTSSADPSSEWARVDVDPILFSGSTVTDADFTRRSTRAVVRYILFRPRRIVRMSITYVAASIVLSAALSHGSVSALWIFPLVLLFFAGLQAGAYALALGRSRKRSEVSYPAGSIFSIALRERTMTITQPLASVEISYAQFTAMRESGGFVFFERSRIVTPAVLPDDLFTRESIEWLRGRIGRK